MREIAKIERNSISDISNIINEEESKRQKYIKTSNGKKRYLLSL
jgi:hypothetical protein